MLQDLTGCANLYADGSAYLRYLGRRAARRARHAARPDPDPSTAYPPAQRRAIGVYGLVLLAGTTICLAVGFAVSVPALIALVARAVSEIGGTFVPTLDGCAALAVLLAWQVLWAGRWWHRHQHQVRSMARLETTGLIAAL